jgi:hypothetical protein
MRTVFFIGSHRTGTKTIANFFSDNYKGVVVSYHQPQILRIVNILTNMYLENFIAEKTYDEFIKYLVVNRIAKIPSAIYIESNGFNFVSAIYAKKHLSDIKIIHLIRDPRDFVASYMNFIDGRLKSRIAHTIIPFWNLSGHRTGKLSKTTWKRMDRFEKYCWNWQFKNQLIIDLYRSVKENFITIRFEDIVNHSTRESSIKKMLNLIDLPFVDASLGYFNIKQNESKVKRFPLWRGWDSQTCQKLESICGPLMNRFHYGSEPEWVDKLNL